MVMQTIARRTKTARPPWLRGGFDDRRAVAHLEAHRFAGLPTPWSTIVGHDHAKRELRVVAAALTRRDLAERLGVPLVSGILVTGPSGSGKTLLARAFAGDVDRPVFVLSAADLDAERISRVYRVLADTPSVVVIDEFDLVARGHHRGRTPTVVALCVALDGVVPISGPITIGLTAESADSLDPSVVRSGRLTTKIVLDEPNRAERLELWRQYLAPIPTSGLLDVEDAADRSQGMTGADIAATARAAAGLALADGLGRLDQAHFDEALERRGIVRRPPEADAAVRRATAIHEAGHAVYAFAVLGRDAIREMVVSRSGRGQGHVTINREWSDAVDFSGRFWRLDVRLSLAGAIAEELVLGADAVRFGSERDIAGATLLVLRAAENGMLAPLGYVSTDQVEQGVRSDDYDYRGSASMRETLWTAVRETVAAEAEAARAVVSANAAPIERLADRLVATGSFAGQALVDELIAAGVVEGRLEGAGGGAAEPEPAEPEPEPAEGLPA